MEQYTFSPVGIVQNHIEKPDDYRKIKEKPSTIEVYETYEEALTGIEANDYLDIIFYFHQSEPATMTETHSYPGVLRGVFASRSRRRPNLIGHTTVKLLERKGNKLLVQGLDAISGTPVLDIKNCDTSLFAYEYEQNPVHQNKLKSSPRIDIRNEIFANRTESLMIKAAQSHGHYCPGLALGIMAATHAMNHLEAESDGMEDLLAITETNNCFADGVQFVTGCTFGNNALIFNDVGKTAFTLTRRDGKGVRIASRPESQQVIREAFPDFRELYKKVVEEQDHSPEIMAEYRKTALDRAFGTLSIDFHKLFTVKEVETEIPEYAKIHDSVICDRCGENIMKTRARNTGEDTWRCLPCGDDPFYKLDGNGIRL